jgi:hypothetical protein
MRCRACNCELNDFEATRKDEYLEYVDLCSDCYNEAYDDNLTEDAPIECSYEEEPEIGYPYEW